MFFSVAFLVTNGDVISSLMTVKLTLEGVIMKRQGRRAANTSRSRAELGGCVRAARARVAAVAQLSWSRDRSTTDVSRRTAFPSSPSTLHKSWNACV